MDAARKYREKCDAGEAARKSFYESAGLASFAAYVEQLSAQRLNG